MAYTVTKRAALIEQIEEARTVLEKVLTPPPGGIRTYARHNFYGARAGALAVPVAGPILRLDLRGNSQR